MSVSVAQVQRNFNFLPHVVAPDTSVWCNRPNFPKGGWPGPLVELFQAIAANGPRAGALCLTLEKFSMKKTLIAFAALSAIAGMAQAQSTVTIYGLLDGNIQSLKTNVTVGGGAAIQSLTQAKIDSGGQNGSRWGIRVKEDLGGGLAAIGNLEAGFNLDTGTSGAGGGVYGAAGTPTPLFGRRANVGLSGGFGTVTIGRNSSSYDDVSGDHTMMAQSIFDPTNVNNGVSTAGAPLRSASVALNAVGGLTAANITAYNNAAAGFLSRNTTWLGYSTRHNNSVKYITPNFGGFSGSLMYGFGEDKTATVGASRMISANLKYANGPLLVSGGYQSEGTVRTASTTPSLDNMLISASYDLGVAKIGAGYNVAKYKDVAPGVSLDSQKEYSLSVGVPLGATYVSASYGRSRGNDFGTSTGFGIQALYSLSKRTTLYAGAQSTKAYDNVANTVKLINPNSNIGNTQTYGVGVRHTF